MATKKQDFNELFTNLAHANQEWFTNLLNNHQDGSTAASNQALTNIYKQFSDNTKTYLEMQNKFYQEQLKLLQNFFNVETHSVAKEPPKTQDKRFVDPDWDVNPFFAYLKQNYLQMSDCLIDFISKSDMDSETKDRLNFFMRQYLDAISPTNFALTNPEVIKGMVETGGKSLVNGMKNMLDDMHKGYMSMTDESVFAIGENLATTPGKIIYKNDLIELIQYGAATTNVYSIPLLIVPPCINKYYILDLQKENSFVKYLVEAGYTVFLISWKSADKSIHNFRWEEYVNLGVIDSINAIRKITKTQKINTLGYCIGGIILTTAYLVLKGSNLDWVNSMTHMTAMLDHEDPGDIKYFIDRDLMELKEARKHAGGIMSGIVISQTFSALRANELIWNYWVSKYLLGKTPKPFDILYWNNDAVDLPVIMHSFLLKRLYLHNELVKGKLTLSGIKMDLNKIDCPVYLFAAQKDHIVPWHSAYKTIHYVKNADVRFVLGASGHTAGVVNPVSADKRNYWVNDKLVDNSEEWFAKAKEVPGSWWKDFSGWLVHLSGSQVKAKKTFGDKEFKPICDAPGEYVRAKALTTLHAESL